MLHNRKIFHKNNTILEPYIIVIAILTKCKLTKKLAEGECGWFPNETPAGQSKKGNFIQCRTDF